MKERRKNAEIQSGETPMQIKICFAESEPAWRIQITLNRVFEEASARFKLDRATALGCSASLCAKPFNC
jgi:hypothetical protein